MNQDIAQIALMFVLPLGITFIMILQSAAAEYRSQKIAGAFFSFIVVVLDCLFYFTKNSFIAYNNDGGLLLSFGSLFFFAILYVIRSEDAASKFANILFAILMFTGILGIAYWERPTLVITSAYSPSEIAEQNAKYQDYISSFHDDNNSIQSPANAKSNSKDPTSIRPKAAYTDKTKNLTLSESAKARLDKYVADAEKVIERMNSIVTSINAFQPIPANASESEREERSSQALAISNNATAVNKKTLGLFHPHESTTAHTELIQASESIRLAAYSLYTYTLQDNPEDQKVQVRQWRNQIAQAKTSLEQFRTIVQTLKSNYQPQQEEN